MESYKHRFGKNAIARWLSHSPRRFLGFEPQWIFKEYPVCIDSDGNLQGTGDLAWDWASALNYDNAGNFMPREVPHIPTYQQCIDAELLPLAIFDVAALYKGSIVAFEIVHAHDIDEDKVRKLDYICDQSATKVYVIDAKTALLLRPGSNLRLKTYDDWYWDRIAARNGGRAL